MNTETLARHDRRSKGIKSVEVGYRVLLAVQGGPGAVKLTDVAKRCGLTTGATHNYITSLVRTGLVEQEDRGRYRLGPSAFALGLTSFRQLNGYDVMRDIAREFHLLTRQSTAVAVWSQGGPVSVFALQSEDMGTFEFRSGHLPLLDSGAGLLFMAFLHEGYTRPLLELEMGASEGGDVDRMIAEARARTLPQGYACHFYSDLVSFALSAPVQMDDGRIPFVLSVVVHKPFPAKTRNALSRELLAAARRASTLLTDVDVGGPKAEYRACLLETPVPNGKASPAQKGAVG